MARGKKRSSSSILSSSSSSSSPLKKVRRYCKQRPGIEVTHLMPVDSDRKALSESEDVETCEEKSLRSKSVFFRSEEDRQEYLHMLEQGLQPQSHTVNFFGGKLELKGVPWEPHGDEKKRYVFSFKKTVLGWFTYDRSLAQEQGYSFEYDQNNEKCLESENPGTPFSDGEYKDAIEKAMLELATANTKALFYEIENIDDAKSDIRIAQANRGTPYFDQY